MRALRSDQRASVHPHDLNAATRPGLGRATVLRVSLAAAVVGWLLWYSGPQGVLESLRSADASLLAAAFLIICLYSALKAWTWQLLLSALGIRSSHLFRDVAACYLTSSMFGAVVPSTAGTDVIRALLAQRRFGGRLSVFLASVVMLNALSWMAACTLGLIAIGLLAVGGDLPRIGLLAAPLFAAVIGAATGIYGLLKWRRDLWLRLLRLTPLPLLRIRSPLRRFARQFLVFQRADVRFGPIFAAALMAQIGFASALALIGFAVGIRLEFLIWPIYGPLVSLGALIPASVSGFGAEQAVYVYLMALVHVPEAQAFAASALLATLVLVFNAGLGAAGFVLSPPRQAPAAP